MRRALRLPAVAACALAILAVSCCPAVAAERTFTLRSAPISVKGFSVKYGGSDAKLPPMDGFVTRMHARVVDRQGGPIPIRRLMLHHIVFLNSGRRDGDKADTTYCKGGRAERFYGTGEEDQSLVLPPGYGYPVRRGDRWRMGWMLMNHRRPTDEAFLEYTVTVTDDPKTTAVVPLWLGAVPCGPDPIWSIRGGKPAGSTAVKDQMIPAPISGRIVAAGAHVHGGNKALVLSQPGCGDRALVDNRPNYGMPDHPYYHVLPVLHEPGPINTTWMESAAGVPIRKGEPLRIRAEYDAEHLHTRVMGIMHVYVAPDDSVPAGCPALPRDVQSIGTGQPHRTVAPQVRVPLTGITSDGRAVPISRPPGGTTRFGRRATVQVRDTAFDLRNLSVARDALVTWRFGDRAKHDVTLANGPFGFASLPKARGGSFRRRFDLKGTYRVYCSLHPVLMTQRIVVR